MTVCEHKKGILLSSFVTHSLLGSLAAQAELGDAPKIYGLVFSYHDIRDSKTNIKIIQETDFTR